MWSPLSCGTCSTPLNQDALAKMIKRMYRSQLQQINWPLYRKLYPDYIDQEHHLPRGFKVLKFTLFSRDGKTTTLDHVARLTYQCGEASGDDLMKLRLFSSSLTWTIFNCYLNLPPNSIFSWWDMQNAFQAQFARSDLVHP